ncbi:hypothetical protein NDS46_26020 [Paenibacillus thiaminolyticus]|uniref:hypothetical protein n=1 Tax=Paenibacillus thiaminolyticus TaxID=49283 RepID=UPI002330B09E|nr:hypothetical protein [Paenibacillus thiaminolyticus]WCF07720.1 hypothetical protein NDS46_26020 [Paenibacillus thiaminolyticus]
MRKKKIPILSMVLYALAGLLMLYTAWSASHSYGYISEMIAMNQLVASENRYEIVNFFMNNCAQYLLFAVILFTLGWILHMGSSLHAGHRNRSDQAASSGGRHENESDEDDFDTWFQKNDN